jgi:hypothetical protein
MVAPKFPKTGLCIPITIFGAWLVLFIWGFIGGGLNTTALTIGLLFDISGASILAIPDIPSVHRRFFSGKVKVALDTLSTEQDNIFTHYLVESGTEDRLIDRILKFKPSEYEESSKQTVDNWIDNSDTDVYRNSESNTEGFCEFMEIFNKKWDIDNMSNIYGIKSYQSNNSSKYAFVTVENGSMGMIGPLNYAVSIRPIENKLNDFESRFRRFGLALLIIGFLFQIMSAVLP